MKPKSTPQNPSTTANNHGSIQPRLNSFFTGIGGFDLGFERAGIKPVYHCEKSTYCRAVLNRHWPNTPCHEDVATVNPANLPNAEIWTGGFPCQDVSLARGKLIRDGLRGSRSGLFYAFQNLVESKLPGVIILENVKGLLSSNEGRDFHTIIQSLTDLGYGVAWRLMNARYYGSPQARPRIFICAWQGSVTAAVNTLYESTPSCTPQNEREGFLASSCNPYIGVYVPHVAYCLAATSGRHTGTDWSRSYVAYCNMVRRLTPVECEGLQGFPVNWTDVEGGQADTDTLRYHALGNAVCVPVAEWIGRRIMANLALEKLGSTAQLEKLLPVVSGTEIVTMRGTSGFNKWRSGGCAIGENIITATVSSAPAIPIISRFMDVIERGPVDKRFFLTPRAARGILRRVASQNRTLFTPLMNALKQLGEQ